MRFETWRGIPLVLGTAAVGLALAWGGPARADGYHIRKTIPREVLAYDYTTGGVMMAPPIPYGHYAKDGLLDCAGCRMHSLLGCLGCGHGNGHGKGCGNCGGKGCGLCSGHGNGGDPACAGGGCGGHGHGHHKAGRFAPCDACVAPVGGGIYDPAGGVVGSSQVMPAGQAVVVPSSQSPCGLNGCGVRDPHKHHGKRCGKCHGNGCGACGGAGMTGCGDPGCGLCNGGGHGGGHGLGHGGHGNKLGGLFHRGNRVEYFVGPGGPVPITPGYVPYINPVRSPRDFFSFPPMNPYDP